MPVAREVGAGQLRGTEKVTNPNENTGLTDDAVSTELLLDDRVVGDRDPLTVNLGVTPLVDELLDGLDVWLAVLVGSEGSKKGSGSNPTSTNRRR
jgi:hypothetical protein